MSIIVLSFALLGGVWRYIDGRGYGPSWLRLVVCAFISSLALLPLGSWAIPMGVVFSVLWLPGQKNREELDDMLLRWAVPFAVFGIAVVVILGQPWSVSLVMILAGVFVSVLVWIGATVVMNGWDSAAVTETLSGAIAFGAIALSSRL